MRLESDVRGRVVVAAAAMDMLAQEEGKAGFISRSLTGKHSPSQICSDICLLGDSKFHQAGNQDQLSPTAYCRHHSLLQECPRVSYGEQGAIHRASSTQVLSLRVATLHCTAILIVKINTAHFGQNALAP